MKVLQRKKETNKEREREIKTEREAALGAETSQVML